MLVTSNKPTHHGFPSLQDIKQEGLAVACIAQDDPSTLPADDLSLRDRMHRDHQAR